MANVDSFNPTVAARTRGARKILETPALLKKYEDEGGSKEDLEGIVGAGEEAEALNSAQSQGFGAGKAATGTVLAEFVRVQHEYNRMMAGLAAVIGDLRRAGKANLVTQAQQILKNEAALHITIDAGEGGTDRKASRSRAQEALRAEIHKDAVSLVAFDAARAALDKRKLTKLRLQKLRDDAAALSGKLAERTVAKGSNKDVTAQEKAAVVRQKDFWGSCYRLMGLVAAKDEALKALLKEGARKR